MTTYFSADPHHGHKKILTYCNRPFATVEEMNSTIIERWNQTVSKDDEVWLLGDFCWKGYENVFHQLNGTKHLIIGNHDAHGVLTLPWASQPRHYHEMKLVEDHGTAVTRLVLCHYGIRSWVGMYKGAVMLYGHSHNGLPGFRTESGGGTLDVGVDAWDFYPVTIQQIKERIAALPLFEPEPKNRKVEN